MLLSERAKTRATSAEARESRASREAALADAERSQSEATRAESQARSADVQGALAVAQQRMAEDRQRTDGLLAAAEARNEDAQATLAAAQAKLAKAQRRAEDRAAGADAKLARAQAKLAQAQRRAAEALAALANACSHRPDGMNRRPVSPAGPRARVTSAGALSIGGALVARVLLVPAGVAAGERRRAQAVGEDREPDGHVDREHDQVLVRQADSSTTITANTIDARPRGPNQPRKPTVGGRARDPNIAIATGSIRTTVRLRTAYSASSQLSSPSAGPSRIAPKSTKVDAVEHVADLLAELVEVLGVAPSAARNTMPADERRDEARPVERDWPSRRRARRRRPG